MSDTIVFDIETQNFFTDPEVGWNNYDALKISVVGLYSYAEDTYHSFTVEELPACADFFRKAECIVGFSMNRYDIPVLQRYFQAMPDKANLDLWIKRRVDLLSEIELATGERVGLSKLAMANLGVGKTGHGAEAIELYRQGEIDKLKAYCVKDVELTKKLYDLYLKDRALLVPRKSDGEVVRVDLNNNGEQTKTAHLF